MRLFLLSIAVLLLAACTSEPPSRSAVDDAFTDYAKQVAERWDESPQVEKWRQDLVILQSPLRLPADWPDPHFDPDYYAGFFTGSYELTGTPPLQGPQDTVTLPDGDITVDVWDATQAYRTLTAKDESPDHCTKPKPEPTAECTAEFTISRMEPGSAHWLTNHGMVSLPTWEYTVDGIDSPVRQLAFDPGEPPPMPSVSAGEPDIPGATAGAVGLDAADDASLRFDVAGKCLSGLRGLVYETTELVLVAASGIPSDDECVMADYESTHVELDAPVGSRVIVSALSGEVLRFDEIYPM